MSDNGPKNIHHRSERGLTIATQQRGEKWVAGAYKRQRCDPWDAAHMRTAPTEARALSLLRRSLEGGIKSRHDKILAIHHEINARRAALEVLDRIAPPKTRREDDDR